MTTTKQRRWYLLWYLAAALGAVSLCLSIHQGSTSRRTTSMQLLNITLLTANGIIDGKRYDQKQKA